jgi:hypothetical protein
MDKDTAEAVLIANLKGSKRKRSSLLMIAEAVRTLLKSGQYKSTVELAKKHEVSRPIIESFDRINDQPKEIKSLIGEGKILLDASTKLCSIADLNKRVKVAKVVAGLSAFDTRYIIDYCKKHPELSAEECKRAVFESKPLKTEIHMVVVPLETEEFNKFHEAVLKKGWKLDEAGKVAINEWTINQNKVNPHGRK